MKVIDYKETMKCLNEVADGEEKTCAKWLLEWAINKRTFEAVPMSTIEKIKEDINAMPKTYPFIDHIDTYVQDKEVIEIIDKNVEGLL